MARKRNRLANGPIIGAGLDVANEVDAAYSHRWRKKVRRNAGSILVLELVDDGCEDAGPCAHRCQERQPVPVGRF